MKRNEGALRIAMLGHKRIPSRAGGVEVAVGELATRMVQMGHCVTCYNRGGKGARQNRGEYLGVRLKNAPAIDCRGFAAMTASFTGGLRAAFGRYDVVHFHAEGPAFMCWLPRLAGKKTVVTIHGLDHQRAKWGKLASAYIMLGERNAAKYADEIIVLSRDTQRYFKDIYRRDTRLVPNGAGSPVIRPAKEIRKLGLQKDSYLLFLGRIVPEKGLQYLIDAFREVKTEKRLVIAGGASDSQGFLREMQQRAAGDERIQFIGFVQGELLDELYSNAYLYCLPSDLEGMPLTLLEAMSYGCCCVISDIPGCTEVAQDKAVVFPKGDVQALEDCLQQLCDDPAVVAGYRADAAAHVCGNYRWEDAAEKTLEIYRQAFR